VEQVFTVSADINTPAGHPVTFNLSLNGDLNITAEMSFEEIIGQIPVLIIDLDENQNSAQAMMDAMANNDLVAEYSNGFPADLNLYSSIFLCLGIYDDNYTLSSSDGQILADYLNNGGNLYMEGGDTWYYDEQTAVHSMFGINATDDGSGDLSTVTGQTGTFTEGMSFNYSGDNNWIDHIEPTGSAFKIFDNQSPAYGTGVAYDEGTYKTIGCSHEFGGLDDGTSPSTKEELMGAYLEFFGFSNVLTALFSSNTTEICEGEVVEFYDMSNGEVIEWDWTFEGGSPGTSSFQNPMVMYSTAGTYDVALTVSDGVDSHSITIEDYMVVNVCTEIEENNIEKISIYPNPNIGIFTVELGNVPGESVSVKVLNSLNAVVFEKKDIAIEDNFRMDMDLSHLHKGLYFLVIENYQGSAVQRIIIR
jgi:PKD repeat protein